MTDQHFRLVEHIKRLQLFGRFRIGEMYALQFLELPIGADALMVHQIDVQQAFGKVPRSAQRLLAIRAVIGVPVEFLKNREHPLAVVKEDFLFHDEHVAEACLVAIEEILIILPIIGIHGAQNLIAALQIVIMQQRSSFPQSTRTSVLIDDFI